MVEIYRPRQERAENANYLGDFLQTIKELKEKDPAAVFIVGVNGARIGGNTENALQIVLKKIESYDACQTMIIHLKSVEMTDSDDAYSEDPSSSKYPVTFENDIPDMHELLLEADGFIFATSTNWGATTPRMGLFINHLTPLVDSNFLLEGKTCAFIVTGEETGQSGVIQNLLWATNDMGMSTPPYGSVYTITGRPGRKSVQIRPNWARQDLGLMGDNMIKTILVNRFSGIDYDRRHSVEQIRRLQALLRQVSFGQGGLSVRLSPGSTPDGIQNP